MKPRLRWTGLIWASVGRERDCYRYWRAWYATCVSWRVDGRFFTDSCSELLPV